MASGIYHSFFEDVFKGNIDVDTDTFYGMVVGASYSFNKDSHNRRDDITDEVSGTGYTAGGQAVTLTVNSIDTANDRVEITIASTSWTSSTISGAQQLIVYKRRGGASSADELVCCVDNGSTVSTTSGTLQATASTIRVQN
jgi:hypothetical protein